jgi:hypothetical protein
MVNPDDLRADVNAALTEAGTAFTLTSYTRSYSGTDYDESYLSSGVTISGLGLLQPISPNHDQQYLEQGKITLNDSKLFIAGSISTSPDMLIRVAGSEYETTPAGIKEYAISGVIIQKTVYCRYNTGSYGLI